jgi:acyl carrier protein
MTPARQRVESAIREANSTALPELGSVDFDAALTSDVGLDSVQVMDLVMEIEDRLELSIPVEVLAEVSTLNELATRLESMIGDRST